MSISLVKDTGEVYNVLCRSEHIVGRNGGHLELENDQSISRRHALLTVAIENKKPVITLTDTGSKYGTFVNDGISANKEIDKNVTINVGPGDRIRFGLLDNIWKVNECGLTVCTSTLSHKEKAELKQLVSRIGGILVSEWNKNCNYLTVNKVTITIKVVCALANSIPIVNMSYWRKLSQIYCSNGGLPPHYDDFLPLLAESSLNSNVVSLKIKGARRRLFEGFTFIVPDSTHRDQVTMMVTSAGGSVQYANNVESVVSQQTIVIQPTSNCSITEQNIYTLLSQKLEKLKLRSIPESEIGLAIVYCSLNMFCNPQYNMNDVLVRMDSNTESSNNSILVPETQNSAMVPSSSSSSSSSSVYTQVISTETETENKRSREDSDASEHNVKKLKVVGGGDGSEWFIESSEREQSARGLDNISDVSSFSIDVKDSSISSNQQKNKRDDNPSDIFAFPSDTNSSAKVVSTKKCELFEKGLVSSIVTDDSDNWSSISSSTANNSIILPLSNKKRKRLDVDDLFAFPSDKKAPTRSMKKDNCSFLSDDVHSSSISSRSDNNEQSKSKCSIDIDDVVAETESNKSANYTFSCEMSNLHIQETPSVKENTVISSDTTRDTLDRTVIMNKSLLRGKRPTCTTIQRNNVIIENFKVFKKGNINTSIRRNRISKGNMSIYYEDEKSNTTAITNQ